MMARDNDGPLWLRVVSTALTTLVVVFIFAMVIAGVVCAARLILWGIGAL